MKELAQLALDVATSGGASYADVRINRYKTQNLNTEDERVAGITDTEDFGFGVRVIVDGAWGFAASGLVTADEIKRVAAKAVEIARASATTMGKPVSLIPEPPRTESFKTPYEIDPFTVDVNKKVSLLLEINDRLLKADDKIKKAIGNMYFAKVERTFASSEGHYLTSDVVTSNTSYTATAVGENDAKTRTYHPPPLTKGYENIDEKDLLDNTQRVAEQAVGHLLADECPVGKKDLILDPFHLSLTMHESVGHPTELDRALGMEESLAGRSFAVPKLLNNLKYGSDIVNFVADNTLKHGLATHGFDDEGVANQRWHIVKDGVFVGYGTSREVAGEINLQRSTGTTRADSWGSIPIVRIPNLSLMPGKKPLSPEELIADTKDGIYIEGMGSFSIDQMRQNFQFGGDAFWEVKDGKLTKMLKEVTYQSITEKFWNSCDAICDEKHWIQNGLLNCGKGDPMQISQMTHGAATARFRQIDVGGAKG